MAKTPELLPFYMDKRSVVPVDSKRKIKSPVFLVDPKFTKKMKEEEKECFEGNDNAGFEEPANPTKWPHVRPEIQ